MRSFKYECEPTSPTTCIAPPDSLRGPGAPFLVNNREPICRSLTATQTATLRGFSPPPINKSPWLTTAYVCVLVIPGVDNTITKVTQGAPSGDAHGIPPAIVKTLGNISVPLLAAIFNRCLKRNAFPYP